MMVGDGGSGLCAGLVIVACLTDSRSNCGVVSILIFNYVVGRITAVQFPARRSWKDLFILQQWKEHSPTDGNFTSPCFGYRISISTLRMIELILTLPRVRSGKDAV